MTSGGPARRRRQPASRSSASGQRKQVSHASPADPATPPGGLPRWRLVAAAVACVLLLAGAAAYVLVSRSSRLGAIAAAPPQHTTSLSAVSSGPRIVFRNTALGQDYGRVAVVSLANPGGPRALTDYSCDRVFATADRTLCLASDAGLVTTYSAKTWTTSRSDATSLPLSGLPSRARLSGDSSLASTTTFVSGDSYAGTSFSTRTVVTHIADGRSLDLENFRLVHQGRTIRPVDRNFWGVTFAADDDTFYATAKFGRTTWLARGRLSTRTLETLHSDAECPSLSPDGSHVAYKKVGNRARGDWRLAVLDLRTGKEVQLTESRSVDDQVEWLDDSHVVYGLPGEGTKAAETNVWVVPADGTGSPTMLIPQAWSPAVIR